MARTGATQDGMDATMRSPSAAGALAVIARVGNHRVDDAFGCRTDQRPGCGALLLCRKVHGRGRIVERTGGHGDDERRAEERCEKHPLSLTLTGRLTGPCGAGQPSVPMVRLTRKDWLGAALPVPGPGRHDIRRQRTTEHGHDSPPALLFGAVLGASVGAPFVWRPSDAAGFRQRSDAQCGAGLPGYRPTRRRDLPRFRDRRREEKLPRQRAIRSRPDRQGMVDLHAGRQDRLHQ